MRVVSTILNHPSPSPITILYLCLCLCSIVFANVEPPPITAYAYLDTSILQTNKSSGLATLTFNAFHSKITLLLTPSKDLVFATSMVEIHSDTGVKSIPISDFNIWPYSGIVVSNNTALDSSIENTLENWARITFHTNPFDENIYQTDHVFEGAIHTESMGTHHIRTIDSYKLSKRNQDIQLTHQHRRSGMIVFTDQDITQPQCNTLKNTCPVSKFVKRSLKSDSLSCGSTQDGVSQQVQDKIDQQNKVDKHAKRQTGCPVTKVVMPVGVAADCTYIAKYGGTQGALKQILANYNSATQVYESTFNFGLGVVLVKLFDTCGGSDSGVALDFNQQCSAGYTINNRLSDFANWRGKKAADSAGLWHLMSTCNSGTTVGIAWLGTACTVTSYEQSSGGVSQWVTGVAVSTTVPTEWKVVAHETGHNFGAIHDCIASNCPVTCTDTSNCPCCPCGTDGKCDCGGKFIMNPTDNSISNSFSPCSIASVCAPDSFVSLQVGICGNGLKELNEECDCGQSCATDPCCNGATCKLTPNSKCDDLNDSCCTSCQLKPKATTCRASVSSCDYVEYCDGLGAQCPPNVYAPNGSSCNSTSSGTTCATGVCTSRDMQCQGYSSLVSITSACADTSSCSLSCQDAKGQCYVFGAFFLDGTPCAGNGSCSQGVCNAGSYFEQIISWIKTYPQFSIPILIVLAIIVLSIIGSCIQRCCFVRRKSKGGMLNQQGDATRYQQQYQNRNSSVAQGQQQQPPPNYNSTQSQDAYNQNQNQSGSNSPNPNRNMNGRYPASDSRGHPLLH